MNKARITYRFEHPEPKRPAANRAEQEMNNVIPLMAEEYSVVEERVNDSVVVRESRDEYESEGSPISSGMRFDQRQPLNHFTTDFGSWSSPFDEETERVERMIRQSGRATVQQDAPRPDSSLADRGEQAIVNGETGYYREPVSQPTYMQGGYRNPDRVSVSGSGSRFERNSRTPWLKIVASVTGAITTGVLIGFFVLSLFSADDGKKGNTGGSIPASKSEGGVTAGTNTGVNTGTNSANADPSVKPNPSTSPSAPASAGASSATVSVRVPARTYTLLQYGAFANQQGADAAQAELRKLGLAAASQASDKVYVYAGLTPGRDEALALSTKLKAQKTEVYIKTLSIPAVTSIQWSGKQATAADTYFTQASKLAASLTNVTVLHLKEATPGPLEDNTLQAIHTVHQAWSGTASAMGEGLAEGQRAVLQKMNTALNTAVKSMDEYKKNPSASFLWQAQNGILQYVLLESELLRAISAG